MPGWLTLSLVTFFGGLGALAAWDLISKRNGSIVWDYCTVAWLAIVWVLGTGGRIAASVARVMRRGIGAPWRVTQRAVTDPVDERLGDLEQRINSLETIVSPRSPGPQPNTGSEDARKDQEP